MFDSGESIIELYRKALEAKKNNKEVLVQEVSNSLESLDDNKPVEIKNSDDPLENFLSKLTGILKENKKSEDPYLIKEITKTVENQEDNKIEEQVEEKTEEVFEDIEEDSKQEIKEENNPLENFLYKLNDILATNKKQSIKNSALNLIEQLKNKEDEPKPKEIKLPPQPELGQVPNVSPPLSPVKKLPKPLPIKKKEDSKDIYVKALENASKDSPKIEKETDQQKAIKEEVKKYAKEFLGKYRNGVVAEGGGGGGNYSTEFKNGGTMDGDLNVLGRYLSGGVDISTIFSGGGGGGSSDRLIAGLQQLILNPDGTITFPDDIIRTSDGKLLSIEAEVSASSLFTKIALSGNAFYAYDSNGNIITFDSVDNNITFTTLNTHDWQFKNNGKFSGPNNVLEIDGDINTSHKILSGGVDLANIFLTSETDSQTLSFNDTTSQLSISNGNNVLLSGYVIPNIQNITQNYFPLSGGTINGNLTINGSLTALGTSTFANTIFTTTSALSVVNTGPGPALYVYQAAGPYDIASFYDADGVEVLHVGNANPNGLGRVGINESLPNEELTVRGSISATEMIYTTNGDSNQWNSTYTTVQSNSASWATQEFSIAMSIALS